MGREEATTAPATGRIHFIRRVTPSPQETEDAQAARLVLSFQSGHPDAFANLYRLYFDRVFTYLRVALGERHEAEDVAQQAFTSVFEALPRYEYRGGPFRGWLFTAVRNHAIKQLEKRHRIDLEEPEAIDRRRRDLGEDTNGLNSLSWITDQDLMLFIERLPAPQRQVLLLRYMLDLSNTDIGRILDRPAADVRLLHHRALGFLRMRLTAIGRDPGAAKRVRWQRPHKNLQVLRARRFALH